MSLMGCRGTILPLIVTVEIVGESNPDSDYISIDVNGNSIILESGQSTSTIPKNTSGLTAFTDLSVSGEGFNVAYYVSSDSTLLNITSDPTINPITFSTTNKGGSVILYCYVNLVDNGSFSTGDLTGWNATNATERHGNNTVTYTPSVTTSNPYIGTHAVQLPETTSISQTLATVYEVSATGGVFTASAIAVNTGQCTLFGVIYYTDETTSGFSVSLNSSSYTVINVASYCVAGKTIMAFSFSGAENQTLQIGLVQIAYYAIA
jgi:hypothetical protein